MINTIINMSEVNEAIIHVCKNKLSLKDKIFYLATKRTDSRINDKNVKQIFIPNELFDFGKTQIEIENIIINIYNEERMLVELIRKKNIMPFDYYKELITSYRKKSDKLDIYKIQEYISYYKNESTLIDTLMREVF